MSSRKKHRSPLKSGWMDVDQVRDNRDGDDADDGYNFDHRGGGGHDDDSIGDDKDDGNKMK